MEPGIVKLCVLNLRPIDQPPSRPIRQAPSRQNRKRRQQRYKELEASSIPRMHYHQVDAAPLRDFYPAFSLFWCCKPNLEP